MKMLWSFLRRRRAGDPSPNKIADVEEAFGTDQEPVEPVKHQPVAVTSSVAPAEPQANLKEASGRSVPPAGDRDEVEHSVAQPAEGYRSPPAVKSRRSRPARGEQRGFVAVPARDSLAPLPKADTRAIKSSVPAPTPNESFVTDASILDMEIEHLRRELAKKLGLQNAQLREMLQRFDQS
jgi:hypothetical protein